MNEAPAFRPGEVHLLASIPIAALWIGFMIALFTVVAFLTDIKDPTQIPQYVFIIVFNILFYSSTYFIFHYFSKRYLDISWEKTLIIFVIFFFFSFFADPITNKPIHSYLISPFYIKGDQMAPALHNGDYVLVKKFNNNFSRGDIVIYQHPQQAGYYLIHRIIGMPNEKIEIKNSDVFINDKKLGEPYVTNKVILKKITPDDFSVLLKENEFFMLGDKRIQSRDSRYYGSITEEHIEGKVFLKISHFE